MGLIDLHTHILPGIDDGPASMAGSVELARALAAAGFTKVVATPHWVDGRPTAQEILERLQELRHELEKQQIPLQVLPGAECVFDPFLPQRLQAGELLTINNSRYLLLEPPANQPLPPNPGELIFELRLLGYYPVIAHPERSVVFQKDPTRLYNLVRGGALTQITLASLTGLMGPEAKQASRAFLDKGLAHTLATDAHSAGLRLEVWREALEVVERLAGTGTAATMLQERPNLIIEDKVVPLPEPVEPEEYDGIPKRRSKRSLFRKGR